MWTEDGMDFIVTTLHTYDVSLSFCADYSWTQTSNQNKEE